nr:hypothetical protein [uncultured Massilia sp.]
MSDALNEYYLALERLKNGRPERVAKGTKITNDAVSLEAGRKKGTIKRSRPIFEELINAISAASIESRPENAHKEQLALAKAEAAKYRVLWEEALAREVSLVKQLWSERAEWAAEKSALTGEKVSSILGKKLHTKGRSRSQ